MAVGTGGALRVGLLGASRIAPKAMIEPARARDDVRVTAVAARDLGRARAFAAEHGIATALDDYDALVRHPEVDAVYNALPPSRHADLTIAALEAGKSVLCEKPFAMNAAEARRMVDAADPEGRGPVLMEAFHYWHHPLFQRVLEVVRSGEIGSVRRIEAVFEAPIPHRPGELRYDPALGGGALGDLGTYCVHWCRHVAEAEPEAARASRRLADTGVDLATEARLSFPGGVEAHVLCAMDGGPRARLVVTGESGRLIAVNLLAPQIGHSVTVEVGRDSRVEQFTTDPTYGFQLAAFVEAVRSGRTPPTGGADCVAQMVALDLIRRAAA